MGDIFDGKVLLITGGTGSFGHAVVDRFLKTGIKEIRIVSRDEKKQDDMRKQYVNEKLKFYIGDVRDYSSIEDSFRGVDYVFSAAALKQVPSCEFYPMEAMKTNVIGSDNVITACINNHVKKAIFLSTDKAAYPINAMVMSAHREENIDIPEKFNSLFPALNKIADEYKMPVIFSVHPRTRIKLEQNGFKLSSYIREEKPFGFFEYLKLQENAFCVLSDSGTLTEESSILNFPAVLIRNSTERQEGVIHGSIMVSGVDYQGIRVAIDRILSPLSIGKRSTIIPDFSLSSVSSKIAVIIRNYFTGEGKKL